MTLRTKGAEKNANNLGTFLENIPIVIIFSMYSYLIYLHTVLLLVTGQCQVKSHERHTVNTVNSSDVNKKSFVCKGSVHCPIGNM